jgi:hypothetical protein
MGGMHSRLKRSAPSRAYTPFPLGEGGSTSAAASFPGSPFATRTTIASLPPFRK